MINYILRRLTFAFLLVLLATMLAFALTTAAGRPVLATDFDPRISKESQEQELKRFGYDRHPVDQYLNWLGVNYLIGRDTVPGLLQGELGESHLHKQKVEKVLPAYLGASLLLNLLTIFITWGIAIPIGAYAAIKQYRPQDQLISVVSYVGMSLPSFFLALLVLWLFAGVWEVLPTGGLYNALEHETYSFWGKMADYAHHLIVPVVVLTIGALARLQRYARGSMLEVMRQQYVTTARAKGLSERKVMFKHMLRNAVNPLITLLGFEFAALFSGSALLEIILNYPGMGQLMLEALFKQDRWLVMAVFLMGAVMLVVFNLVAEILLALVDPRVSYD